MENSREGLLWSSGNTPAVNAPLRICMQNLKMSGGQKVREIFFIIIFSVKSFFRLKFELMKNSSKVENNLPFLLQYYETAGTGAAFPCDSLCLAPVL
jgi:hypothetical protein